VIVIPNEIKIIGVTGNSGSGKSTVSNLLKSLGAYLIMADEIAHKIIMSDAYVEIVKTFGTDILKEDSLEIDRKKLGNIVFNDEKKLVILNSITHSYIIKSIINEIKLLYFKKDEYKFIVIDAALLIETKLNEMSDQVWLVHADEKLKIKRLIERDKLSENQIIARLKNQMPFEEAKKFADVIIINNGTYEQLEEQVKKNIG
jgi:dephospho-CoA kinase